MDYFAPIIGHDNAKRFIKKIINEGIPNHAYLFIGPDGVGKMLTARAFAASILSQVDASAGIYLRDGMHPDQLIIEKAENRTLISKEQITKDMEPWLALKPYRAGNRIAIIRDAQLLSLEAANALLKTLEEPPGHAIIILVSDQAEILETIISRCQIIRFNLLGEQQVEKFLIQTGLDMDKAERAAHLSQGSPGMALRLANEGDMENIWQKASSIFEEIAGGQQINIYNAAEKMAPHPELITIMIVTIIRDILIYKETGQKDLLSIPEHVNLKGLIDLAYKGRLKEALNQITLLQNYYRRNVNVLLININICYAVWNIFH